MIIRPKISLTHSLLSYLKNIRTFLIRVHNSFLKTKYLKEPINSHSNIDGFVKSPFYPLFVIPAKAGNQYYQVIRLGVNEYQARMVAASRKGPWAMSNMKPLKIATSNSFFAQQGFFGLFDQHNHYSIKVQNLAKN